MRTNLIVGSASKAEFNNSGRQSALRSAELRKLVFAHSAWSTSSGLAPREECHLPVRTHAKSLSSGSRFRPNSVAPTRTSATAPSPDVHSRVISSIVRCFASGSFVLRLRSAPVPFDRSPTSPAPRRTCVGTVFDQRSGTAHSATASPQENHSTADAYFAFAFSRR